MKSTRPKYLPHLVSGLRSGSRNFGGARGERRNRYGHRPLGAAHGGLAHESPQHFYEAVTAAIEKREIPDCRLKRVMWREGGWFSAKREYLRAKRAGYLIDICGAPFGNAFFSSSWLCFPPPSVLVAVVLVIIGCIFGFNLTGGLVEAIERIRIPEIGFAGYWRERLIERSVWCGFRTIVITDFGIVITRFGAS